MDDKNVEFKLEFEGKLHKLNIRDKFIKNIKTQRCLSQEKVDALNNLSSWASFISSAFAWFSTPEGNEFWYNIHKQ